MIRSILTKNSTLPYYKLFLKRSFISKPNNIIAKTIINNNCTKIIDIKNNYFKYFTTTSATTQQQQQQQQQHQQQEPITTSSTSKQQLKETEEINENITKYKISLTDNCVKELNNVERKLNSPDVYLRVMVDMGGCSGYQYIIKIDNKLQDEDVLFIRNGAKVIIDKISLEMMEGSVIDYEAALMRSSFVVASNPNTIKSCGCKISFDLKK
ncbi:hypothetical protein RB653_000957 [Dictyostelium firmibasis]|uniref:Core domain-containing protein n=1 Tax=Dictyostelium firmibasis TaxID=79012 RepID=A0AAN7U3J7_9MYCE